MTKRSTQLVKHDITVHSQYWHIFSAANWQIAPRYDHDENAALSSGLKLFKVHC